MQVLTTCKVFIFFFTVFVQKRNIHSKNKAFTCNMNKVNFFKGLLNICMFWGVFLQYVPLKEENIILKKKTSHSNDLRI